MIARRLRDRLGEDRPDSGYTLTELLVSMSVLAVVLALVFGVLVTITTDLRKSQNMADSTAESQRAFLRLEKQVRYASAVNAPVQVGSAWYLEFQTTASGSPECTQWRLDGTTHRLQYRQWTVAASVAAPPWITAASGIVNDVASSAEQPFVFTPALYPSGNAYTRQLLDVHLLATDGNNPPGRAETRTRFVARNTSTATTTNTLDGAGVSVAQVCQEVPRS